MQQEQEQEQINNNTSKKIYFKWVNTENTLYLTIDSSWTLSELIEYVKNKVGDQNIELVQTGQGTDTLASEDAEAEEPLNDVTIYQKFGYDWTHNYLAFYIRKMPEFGIGVEREEIISFSGGGGGGSVVEPVDRECVICMESFPITDWTPYGCPHFACTTCVKSCIRTNNNRCSICRLD